MVRASIIRVRPVSQVDRAVNVDASTFARLLYRELLWPRPAADRPRRMVGCTSFSKQHCFVVAQESSSFS